MSYIQPSGLRKKIFILFRTFTFVYITDQDPRVRVYCSTRSPFTREFLNNPTVQVINVLFEYFKMLKFVIYGLSFG